MAKATKNKDDIIRAVSDDTGISQSVVRAVLDALENNIVFEMCRGNSVQFTNFGKFEPKHRAARTGRNPHTNTPVRVPERVIPSFKPSKKITTIVVFSNEAKE